MTRADQLQERMLRSLGAVAPRAAAAFDWIDASKHSSWGGPMNGQAGRQQITRSLLGSQAVERIVETGTYRGMTTLFLSQVSGAHVLSVEANPRFYHFARRRFIGTPKVTITLGDSRAFLDRLSRDEKIVAQRTFFYLDAHWGADCPLADEVRLICDRWADPLVMIDDFAVPDDPDYAYDVYPNGHRFDLDYLPREDLTDFRVLFPTLPGAQESGARRGCALLSRRNQAGRIAAQVPTLRLYPSWPSPSTS